jgi:RNA polymerase sigma-70 factor (ECF subfamily)
MTVTYLPDIDSVLGTRAELREYCSRMLGCRFDAEDAVQETLMRAWKSITAFQGRCSLRTWLYRIATNVCFDALRQRQRRPQPVDSVCMSSETTFEWDARRPRSVHASIDHADPAERVVAHDMVGRAFVAALQHLPPRQRAVLILRDVLQWRTKEVAALLGTTTVAVNSSLQRARATLAARDIEQEGNEPVDAHRLVEAFERHDVDALVALLERGQDDVSSGARGGRVRVRC